ncbi:MAG: hypothetical protein P2A85_29455 (plasmid) [Microcoleus anatoxicus]|uniref:hypothetical protein n=1 Tax=Microcoleus anatoxicus TaxID=2705319 RepID=UPI00366F3F31
MNIRTIAVSYTRKFNLLNFNSVDLSCSLWAQIDPEEDEDSCIQILQDKVREAVRCEYHKVTSNQKAVPTVKVNGTLVEDFIPEGEEYEALGVNPAHLQ